MRIVSNANFLVECNRCDRRRDDTDVDDGRGHQWLKRADLQSQQTMNRFLHMGPVASMQAREQRTYLRGTCCACGVNRSSATTTGTCRSLQANMLNGMTSQLHHTTSTSNCTGVPSKHPTIGSCVIRHGTELGEYTRVTVTSETSSSF